MHIVGVSELDVAGCSRAKILLSVATNTLTIVTLSVNHVFSVILTTVALQCAWVVLISVPKCMDHQDVINRERHMTTSPRSVHADAFKSIGLHTKFPRREVPQTSQHGRNGLVRPE